MTITIKTPDEINKLRIAGRLAAEVLEMIGPHVKEGVTTDELNQICHDYIVNVQKAIPAPLNYNGFPKSICTSVNHQVCHGIPGPKKLKEGDIVNIDITVLKDEYHGDTSKMFVVGKPSILADRLIKITQECLYLGIQQIKPGARFGDIGAVIQEYAEKNRFFSRARILRSWYRKNFSRTAECFALRHTRHARRNQARHGFYD